MVDTPDDPNANLEFGFLSRLTEIHFPTRKPCIGVGVFCDAGLNFKPSIEGGEGKIIQTSLFTFTEGNGLKAVQVGFIVNLTTFKPGETAVVCSPGVGPQHTGNWTTWDLPINNGFDVNTSPAADFNQVRAYLGDAINNADGTGDPSKNKHWSGYMVVNYYPIQLGLNDGFLTYGDIGFSAWPLDDFGNAGLHTLADIQIQALWALPAPYGLRYRTGLGNNLFAPPPLDTWVGTGSSPGSFDTHITFTISDGRFIKGPFKGAFGQTFDSWAAARANPPKTGPDRPQSSFFVDQDGKLLRKKTEAEVFRDTVTTHANPITEQSVPGARDQTDPETDTIGLGFRLQSQNVAQAGFDRCTLPESWNLRDGQTVPDDPKNRGQLLEGSTFDQWEQFFNVNVAPFNTPPGPDSLTIYEIDDPANGGTP